MKRKITVDGKTKIVKLRDEATPKSQMVNKPVVYKNKKAYTRKVKHKGWDAEC